MPKCLQCVQSFATVDGLQSHLYENHDLLEIEVFRCQETQCFRDFSSWKSFKKHLTSFHNCELCPSIGKSVETARPKKKHKTSTCSTTKVSAFLTDVVEFVKGESSKSSLVTNVADKELPDELQLPKIHSSETSSEGNVFDDKRSNGNIEQRLLDIVSSACAKLYAVPDLPRSMVQDIMDITKNLIDEMTSILRPELQRLLQTSDEREETIDKIFDACSAPFISLSTEYRRIKHFKERGLILPNRYIVGVSVDDKYVNGTIIKERSSVYAQSIPLKETLRYFFGRPDVLKSVLDNMKKLMNNTEIISNFVQGQLWRDKVSRYFEGKTVIPLFIYYDDFEVNNPLGSHSGIQKLGGIYCTVPCLPPEFCSTIENIFTVLLFHAADRKNFGNESIFQILVDELNDLQDIGIVFNLDGIDTTIYFALGLITGDNLGVNSAFDMVESFNLAHFCRFCYIAGKDAKVERSGKIERLRCSVRYEDDIASGPAVSGIKKRSVWNNVKYFHIYENFYVDPLHDLAEGALKYGISHILNYYTFGSRNKISLDFINDRMRTFNYTINGITNKPPLLTVSEVKDRHLRMSASELINFFHIFPMLVGDEIVVDEVWRFFSILRNIMNIVSAKKIQPECFVLLDYYVSEHHRLYRQLFNDTLKAKHHNMVHYGRIMRMSGPVSHLTTIRCESKNRQFKLSASATYSRRNITFTLAMKEAFKVAYRQTGLVSHFDAGPGHVIGNLAETEDYRQLVNSNFDKTCIEVPWVKLSGIVYRIGTCLALYFDFRDIPVFGIISSILYNELKEVRFRVQLFQTVAFVERFDAWELLRTDKFEFREHNSLLSPFICILHRMRSGKEFATVKYAL